jgi:hypothetical protein
MSRNTFKNEGLVNSATFTMTRVTHSTALLHAGRWPSFCKIATDPSDSRRSTLRTHASLKFNQEGVQRGSRGAFKLTCLLFELCLEPLRRYCSL